MHLRPLGQLHEKEVNIEATKVRVKSVLPRKITMAPLHVSHTGGD